MNKHLCVSTMTALYLSFGIASTATAQEIVLGYSGASSGPYASLAKTNAIAVELAVQEINAAGGVNGKKLVVSTFDTGGKPEQAAIAVQRFAQDLPALGIIGPFSTSECRVAFPVGERLGIPQMSMASSAPGVSAPFTYAFRNTTDDTYSWERLFRTVKQKNYSHSSVSIVYATDDGFSQSLGTKVLPPKITEAAIPLINTVTLRAAAFDHSAQVSQLMQKPTDLIAVGTPPDAMLKLVAELRRQGYKGRMLGGSGVADSELPARMGPSGEGTLVAATFHGGMEDERTKAFVKGFKERLQAKGEPVRDPNQFDAASYDIVFMYVDAIKRAKLTGDPSRIVAERKLLRDELRKLKNYPALVGPLSINAEGDTIKVIYVLEAKGGQWVLVDRHPAN